MANIHNYSKTTREQITQTGGPDFGTNYGHILVSNVTSDTVYNFPQNNTVTHQHHLYSICTTDLLM